MRFEGERGGEGGATSPSFCSLISSCLRFLLLFNTTKIRIAMQVSGEEASKAMAHNGKEEVAEGAEELGEGERGVVTITSLQVTPAFNDELG